MHPEPTCNQSLTVDEQFAVFCATGDAAALGAVIEATGPRLLQLARWLAGNRADADDVLQRTFLQAIETRHKFEPGKPALPWLKGLLGNQARKVLEERRRRRKPPAGAELGIDPTTAACSSELAQQIEQMLAKLGEPYSEALHLHLHEGLNAKEIARRLARPNGTVRTQLARGLALLRDRLPAGFVGNGERPAADA